MSVVASTPGKTMLGVRAAGFVFVFAVMQLVWQSLHGTSLRYVVVHDAIVRPAAFLVNTLTPDVHATAVNFSVLAPGGGVEIRAGCDGMEVVFLLLAAFVVTPMSWLSRIAGFLLGTALIFVVNESRVLTLFYAYRSDPALFERLHAVVAPLVVVLIVCAYFYAWLTYSSRRLAESA